MPFNFPITPNRSGEIFANAFQNAIGSYYQAKQFQRQKQFDTRALAGQDLERSMSLANAARQGIHFDDPNSPVPNEPLAPRVTAPTSASGVADNMFRQTMNAAMSGTPNPRIEQPMTPNERADAGELQLPERTFFKGGYINNREGMIPMLLNATMKAREAGMVKGAEKSAEEPYAVTAFQRGLQGDVFKSGLDVQKERTLAGDRATALTGAQLPGGQPITPQQAAAVANNPGTAGSLFRSSANVPLTPEWFKAKEAESNIIRDRTVNLLAPRTADALTRKQGELALTPLNKTEDTATQQLPRMVSALSYLQKHGTPSALSQAASNGNFTNYLNSGEGRQLVQAAEQAAMAGALATEGPRGAQPTRVEFFRKTYVPRGGDDPATVARKLDQLRELAKAVKVSAGRGYERMDPGQRAQVEQFIGNGAASGGAFTDLIPKKP